MATKVVHEALENARVTANEITTVVSTMHTPYPIPSLSVLLQDTFNWSEDCAHLAVTTVGCAGGAFGLREVGPTSRFILSLISSVLTISLILILYFPESAPSIGSNRQFRFRQKRGLLIEPC